MTLKDGCCNYKGDQVDPGCGGNPGTWILSGTHPDHFGLKLLLCDKCIVPVQKMYKENGWKTRKTTFKRR